MTTAHEAELYVTRCDPRTRKNVAACQAIIDEHSKSFALASRLLPARCRDDAVAMYAWCRRADDAIDHPGENSVKESLARLREELTSLYSGEPQADPVLVSFQAVAKERRLPSIYPLELLRGMEMDIDPIEYRTIDDLLLYCHRVAGVVGLMMCHVMGIQTDDALPHAAHLGLAMQLTNICRDVEEDWRRGRCYLPMELLTPRTQAVLTSPPIGNLPAPVIDDLRAPIRTLLELAERYYRSGDAGLVYLDRRSAWAIRTARLVYSAIGSRIARQGYDVGAGRAYVPIRAKFTYVCQAFMESWAEAIRGGRFALSPQIPQRLLKYPQATQLDGNIGT